MFALVPLGDLTRFRRSDIKSKAYLVTEDVCIKSHGILLAARSAKLEKMVEESENIPAVECSEGKKTVKVFINSETCSKYGK